MEKAIDFNKLKKSEILWLFNTQCSRHPNARYSDHPSCYVKDFPDGGPIGLPKPERIGFLDIEATSLNASFGFMLCYCIKPEGGKVISRCVTPEDIRQYRFDMNLISRFNEDAKKFDRFIGYYSKDYRFDLPFLRTRALKWGVPFPEYRDNLITDCYDFVKAKLKLHRSRLENAADLLDIPSKAHRLVPEVWQKAQAGDKKALDYILKHCQEDVITLEGVWKKLRDFGKVGKTSI